MQLPKKKEKKNDRKLIGKSFKIDTMELGMRWSRGSLWIDKKLFLTVVESLLSSRKIIGLRNMTKVLQRIISYLGI